MSPNTDLRILGCTEEQTTLRKQFLFDTAEGQYVAAVIFIPLAPRWEGRRTCFEMVGEYEGREEFELKNIWRGTVMGAGESIGSLEVYRVTRWVEIPFTREIRRENYPLPEPTPTPEPTVTPTATTEPTATMEPTVAPVPTPALTLEPTATPTPRPTATPTPVPTATPGPTTRPTAVPIATPAPNLSNWYQDVAYEAAINDFLESEGFEDRAQIATLDAEPTGWAADLSLSLGCIGGFGVAYLTPYSYEVSPSVDTYVVGIWDDKNDRWVQEDLGWYSGPVLTDDGSSIYIANRSQILQIIDILEIALDNRNPDLILTAGMFESQNDDEPGSWGELYPDGLQAVLRYLSCLQ